MTIQLYKHYFFSYIYSNEKNNDLANTFFDNAEIVVSDNTIQLIIEPEFDKSAYTKEQAEKLLKYFEDFKKGNTYEIDEVDI